LAKVPVLVFESTVEAAAVLRAGKPIAEAASSTVAALVQKVVRTMFWTKLRIALAMVAAVSVVGSGVALMAGGTRGGDAQPGESSLAQAAASDQNLADDDLQPGVGAGPERSRGSDRSSKERLRTANNLKQLALATHSYHD